MKSQTPYRGGENKKPRITKADKLYMYQQKLKKQAAAAPKKEVAA